MFGLNGSRMFPCPVCTDPREVRLTKKRKPYITCDPCGIQVFIRGPAGIAAFERLVDRGTKEDLWTRLSEGARKAVRTLNKKRGAKVAIAFNTASRKGPGGRTSCARLKKRKKAPEVSKAVCKAVRTR
jgi:hypothetical protein